MTGNEELKPCKCGGTGKVIREGAGITERYFVSCEKCGLRVENDFYIDEESAIAAWNRRHNDVEAEG